MKWDGTWQSMMPSGAGRTEWVRYSFHRSLELFYYYQSSSSGQSPGWLPSIHSSPIHSAIRVAARSSANRPIERSRGGADPPDPQPAPPLGDTSLREFAPSLTCVHSTSSTHQTPLPIPSICRVSLGGCMLPLLHNIYIDTLTNNIYLFIYGHMRNITVNSRDHVKNKRTTEGSGGGYGGYGGMDGVEW